MAPPTAVLPGNPAFRGAPDLHRFVAEGHRSRRVSASVEPVVSNIPRRNLIRINTRRIGFCPKESTAPDFPTWLAGCRRWPESSCDRPSGESIGVGCDLFTVRRRRGAPPRPDTIIRTCQDVSLKLPEASRIFLVTASWNLGAMTQTECRREIFHVTSSSESE